MEGWWRLRIKCQTILWHLMRWQWLQSVV